MAMAGSMSTLMWRDLSFYMEKLVGPQFVQMGPIVPICRVSFIINLSCFICHNFNSLT